MRAYLVVLFSVAAISIAACSLFDKEDDVIARISEKGVDGIQFGDSIDEVREKLNEPKYVGWIDGDLRSWFAFTYGTDHGQSGIGSGDTLKIRFTIPSGGPDSLSVVDAFGLYNGYTGMTAKNIGLGATTQEIIEAYGEPQHRVEGVGMSFYYCLGRRQANLYFSADTLTIFSFGFHEPLQDYYVQCQ